MKKTISSPKLTTPWSDSVGADNVWKEYPRPAMVRKSWLNLNGLWECAFTRDGSMPESFDETILVPFSPESPLSGVERQLLPDEFLWYRRNVTIQPPAADHRLLLHFGAVDHSCIVYIDGREAGRHAGGYLPFCLDITPLLPAAAASDPLPIQFTLTVRVQDPSDTSWHAKGKQKLKRGGMFYTAQSGIWQTVWMEEVPSVYISSVLAKPDWDASCCRLLVHVTDTRQTAEAEGQDSSRSSMGEKGAADTCFVTARVRPETEADRLLRDDPSSPSAPPEASCPQETAICLRVKAGTEAVIPLPGFHAWSPEDPFLYHLTLETEQDRVECYFAMRKCDVQTDENGQRRIFLNNRPLFQAGVLDQGYWPDGLYTAPCDEALIFDIASMKKLGFNMLRKHVKLEPQRWYYHCDRLGMLVWQDMVCGGTAYRHWFVTYLATVLNALSLPVSDGKKSRFFLSRREEEGQQEFLQEMEETVRTLRIHPCIVCWVPFNEGWGQFDAAQAAERLSRLDPGRLIDHASGWFDQGAGDIASIHYYFFSLRVRPEPKRALALTEFGGYSWQIPEHSFGTKLYGYGKYQDQPGLTEGYRALICNTVLPAVRKGVSATIYTQLSDIEDEVNGILTYDRKVMKLNPAVVQTLNELLYQTADGRSQTP